MGKGDKERDKDPKEKARLAKETAERESRERRLTARAVSQSLHDGLSGGAAAAAAAAAVLGAKGGKGARSAQSPPRNSTNDGSESVATGSPATPRRGRSLSGRRVESSPDQSENDGTDKSVAASESEDEQLTTNSKITASNKLKQKTRIRVDSNAT